MRRLYLQIFLAFVVILIVATGTTLVVGRLLRDDDGPPPMLDSVARLLIDDLRSPELPADERQARFRKRCDRLGIEAVLLDSHDEPVLSCAAGAGHPPPAWPRGPGAGRGWRRHGGKSGMLVDVGDGQRLWAVPTHRQFHRDVGRVLGGLALVTLILAAGSYLLARRVTRRLAAVEVGVKSWGEGDLTARAPVSGHDEVASVAQAFNAAADKVASLLEQQRRTLAHASHELRSPLARLRMAIELLAETPASAAGVQDSAATDAGRQRLRSEAERNIEELDALVEELLMAARLDAGGAAVIFEEIDFGALVGEECNSRKIPCVRAPAPLLVRGDARLLRRLVRNLLDNAERHAGGATDVEVTGAEASVVLLVRDRGPGVPVAHRERIFEPFARVPGHAESKGGVGLGLSLVRQISTLHGGEVRCEAAAPESGGEARGSVFIVRFPRADTPARAPVPGSGLPFAASNTSS